MVAMMVNRRIRECEMCRRAGFLMPVKCIDNGVRSTIQMCLDCRLNWEDQSFQRLCQATASISRRAATLWTWIARRRAVGTCSLRRVPGRRKSRTSSWARQKRKALVCV
ncbi:hypothetical protein N825_32310 [Skermanella stibiiresistens SB22]|uniref:Uncharacterized protein n=1 Tax=Skermanella stibiiresistens SB22 TaxID=1385369 RepID=W9GQ60_9PROT|nr:hypothetical protein N825_32310 [Skermanella stibiiresistens SB22]